MAALPVDVIVEILCRLPVKSLLRFRCLSKQFRSIIDGPYFINRHLQIHSLNQRLIVHRIPSIHGSEFFSADIDSANNLLKLEHPSCDFGYHLIGSCNGLLALADRRGISVGLWNISTKKHRILPKFWSDFNPPRNAYDFFNHVFDGFGYDVTSDDYKWVRVIYSNFTEVTVYSLKTNSWRRIEDLPPYHNYYVEGRGVLVGGALNWLVRLKFVADDSKWRVLSFDLKGEQFCQVSLPEIADEDDDHVFQHVVFGGRLCLSCFSPLKVVLDVWAMMEYGVKESWIKLFSFTGEMPVEDASFYLGIRAFTFSKRGNKFLLYKATGEVILYGLEKETYEVVEINEWAGYGFGAAIYVDSLVSPNVNI